MIPSGDHSSRSILHRRVSSYEEIVTPPVTPRNSLLVSTADADGQEGDLTRPLLPFLEDEENSNSTGSGDDDTLTISSALSLRFRIKWKLWIVFVLLVLSGVSNVVLAKLQSLPM